MLALSFCVAGLIVSDLSITTLIAVVILVLSGFLNVIVFFPSGAVYPVASFPSWLKVFAKINPEAYAVSALKAILFKGATPRNIIGNLLFLVCFTIVM